MRKSVQIFVAYSEKLNFKILVYIRVNFFAIDPDFKIFTLFYRFIFNIEKTVSSVLEKKS